METRKADHGTATAPGASRTQQPTIEEVSSGDGIQFKGEDAEGCCSSSAEEFDFEFEFAPLQPPTGADGEADADDLFDAGRMWPGHHYPVFARPHPDDEEQHRASSSNQLQDAPASSTYHEEAAAAPEGAEDYCVWVPKKSASRGAGGTAAGDLQHHDATWKSLSASAADASRRWRLRDLMHTAGRSHSDGTEKFAFLVPIPHRHAEKTPRAAASAGVGHAAGSKTEKAAQSGRRAQDHHQQKKGVTELDIATAHRLFYAKNGGNGGGGGGAGLPQPHRQSYLPYRKDLVGYFSSGGTNGPHTRFLPF